MSKPLAAVLALLAAAVLGLAVYDVYGNIHRAREPAAEKPPAPIQAQRETHAAKGGNARDIVAAHLFGTAPSETPVAVVEQAPETQLSLELAGVIASNDTDLSRAIISANSGNAKSYAIGDTIEGTDARLYSVEPGRVLIERRGQFESMPLIRSRLGESSSPERGPNEELPPLGLDIPTAPQESGTAPGQPGETGPTPEQEAAALIPNIPFEVNAR